MRKILGFVVVGLLLLGAASTASATSFTLDLAASGMGSGPFGTVTLTQSGANTVDVLVQLNAGVAFVNTGNGSNHPDFAFNLSGAPSPTVVWTIVQSGQLLDAPPTATTWSFVGPGSYSASSFGNYGYAFNCTNCSSGASDPALPPLEFTIALSGITPASFVANADGIYFIADVINGYSAGGPTGLVAADGPTTPVPEPASMVLLGSGLLGAGFFRRRQKKS
jgi:hypothetical protein